MTDKLRFLFEGIAIPTAPVHISIPNRDETKPPLIFANGQECYLITATGLRGGIRRYCAKHLLRMWRKAGLITALQADILRLLMIGGVKDDRTSRAINPVERELIRNLYPLIDVFGAGDPIFIGGTLFMGLMISSEVVRTSRGAGWLVDPATTLPIVRRPILNDPTLSPSDITNPETLLTDAAANRRRSQVENALATWGKLDKRTGRRAAEPLSPRDLRTLAAAKEVIKTEAKASKELTFAEAEQFFASLKVEMSAAGQKTNSEQTLHSFGVIPTGTQMNHKLELHFTTPAGVGLFMAGWHDKTCFDPVTGGLVARGCGGFLESNYIVKRQEDYDWIDDCTLVIKPNYGIEFHNAEHSVLKAMYQQWQEIDIARFAYDIAGLNRIINGGDE